MTISRDQYDNGEDEVTECLKDIFTKYSDEAFALKELSKATALPTTTISAALIALIGKGFIQGKFVGLEYYYILTHKK